MKTGLILLICLVLGTFPALADEIIYDYSGVDTFEKKQTDGGEAEEAQAEVLPDHGSHTFDFGFYIAAGSQPGGALSAAAIRKEFIALIPYASTLRFYGAAGELEKAYPIAKELGFRVYGGAWLCGSESADKAELDALIRCCNAGYVDIAIVGSETLLRGDLTADELVSYMEYVRSAIPADIPVTTADSYYTLCSEEKVIASCDLLMINFYPYWNGVGVNGAAETLESAVESLAAAHPDKRVVVSETGWPTAGDANGSAVPGEEAAALYYGQVAAWAEGAGYEICWFEAVDEGWKASSEGTVGAHWGFFTSDLKLKECYEGLLQ